MERQALDFVSSSSLQIIWSVFWESWIKPKVGILKVMQHNNIHIIDVWLRLLIYAWCSDI